MTEKLPKQSSKERSMTPDVRPLVAGNWKMNGTGESLEELRIIVNRPNSAIGEKIDALICVPATLVFRAAQSVEGEALSIGGQDCHTQEVRRAYRRYLGGHAERCRRIPCHCWTFRTPDGPWRNGRYGQRKGEGGLGSGACGDHLHWRDRSAAPGRRYTRRGCCTTCGFDS